MPQSLANILVHITFSTKERRAFLIPAVRGELSAFIAAAAREYECPAIKVESVADHVHLVVSMSRKRSLSELIKRLKMSSSRWLKTKGNEFSAFQWQRGYGAFSISQSALQDVLDYLAKQEDHHKRMSFQDEFRAFLEKHGIEYDIRYVWD